VGRGGLEVRHREERVRGRLEPDEIRVLGRSAGLVELDVLEAPAAELVEQDAGPVVRAPRERDDLARLEHGEDDRRAGCGARREEHRLAAVEVAERALRLRDDRAP
jgi:hypothetical protein